MTADGSDGILSRIYDFEAGKQRDKEKRMGDRVERDPKAMHAFVKQWDEYVNSIQSAVRDLEVCCSSARSVLKDAYTSKIIAKLEEYGPEILRAVQQGDEPVRELERSAKVLDELDER